MRNKIMLKVIESNVSISKLSFLPLIKISNIS